MAPTTSTSKRSRPSFSPPRPGKSKVQKPTKEQTTSARKKKSLIEDGSASRVQKSGSTAGKAKPKAGALNGKGTKKEKYKGAAGTMRAILDEASDDAYDSAGFLDGDKLEDVLERRTARRDTRTAIDSDPNADDDEDAEKDEDGEDDEGAQDSDATYDPSNLEEEDEAEEGDEEIASLPSSFSSPEPDFILAEISHPSTSKTPSAAKAAASRGAASTEDPAIPLPLIHRIMHAHFTSPEHTKISPSARHLLGKYVEVFVKEAVRRCVDQKKERARIGGGDDDARVGDTGWLEVEDLERVGGQLVLDF